MVEESQARIVKLWKEKLKLQVFHDMFLRQKWKLAVRNLQVGEIGHIAYKTKFGAEAWHLAMISKVKVDDDSFMCTVVIKFRH